MTPHAQHVARLTAIVTTLAPAPLMSFFLLVGSASLSPWLIAAAAAALMLAIAGIAMPFQPRIGKFFGSVGTLVGLGALFPHLRESPSHTLIGVTTTAGLLAFFYRRTAIAEGQITLAGMWTSVDATRLSAVAALLTAVFAATDPSVRLAPLCAATSLAVSGLFTISFVFAHRTALAGSHIRLVFALAIALLGVWLVAVSRPTHTIPSAIFAGLFSAPLIGLVLSGASVLREDTAAEIGFADSILAHPARLLVATFLVLSLVGSVLLSLPASAATDTTITMLDAMFTAVSAVCVTGLIVLDTPNDFSGLGQGFILLLIQVGGLGIMAFYTAAFRLLGRRVSLRHEAALAGLLSPHDRSRLYTSLRQVFIITAVFELAGAALLATRFGAHGDNFGSALWRGLFTAISAFCNAGFALQSDSLIPYQNDPVIIHTVGVLIIAGGLSPPVIVALPRMLARKIVPLQIRLALITTITLLLIGALAYLTFEWSNSLSSLSRIDRLHNAWFQSITLRTAGFNSVDLVETKSATRSLMMVFMFIGGCPGGTAGGIKTTTVAVLLVALHASLRGRDDAITLGRRISPTSVLRALAVLVMGAFVTAVALLALQLTQRHSYDIGLFEIMSALGTVGLSLGATAELDSIGKVIIMTCMFAGRVGPLSLLLFIVDRESSVSWSVPEEKVEVG